MKRASLRVIASNVVLRILAHGAHLGDRAGTLCSIKKKDAKDVAANTTQPQRINAIPHSAGNAILHHIRFIDK